MTMQRRILTYLAKGVAGAEKRFDRKTGRFLADNRGWAVTNQDIIFPLALLYVTPGTRHHASDRILELCLRGGTALRNWQYPDGSFEFVKTDGSRWGPIFMPWSIYHWCEAYALLREHMCVRRRRRWEEGLTLAYEGVARVVARPIGHNIAAWHGMSLVRGGQVFERDDWLETGTRQVLYTAERQHPDGFWPEGDGPTVGYNLVYVHALGLYHAFTGDRAVLPALRRASEFHATFTYPDGSPVETVDGRQRYHASVPTTGWPGFLLFPEGRGLVGLWLERITRGGGGLAPHLASVCQHFAGELETARARSGDGRVVYRQKALVRRSGPWFICVSGYVPELASRAGLSRNRWIMARANCLSVWHNRLGLVIGGGNSKHDPFFATFEVWQDGAMRIEPDEVTFSRRGARDTARFRYGGLACLLHIRLIGPKRIEITFELPAATTRHAQVQAGFTMCLPAGGKLRWARSSTTLDPMRTVGFGWKEKDRASRRVVSGKGWSLRMPGESAFSYPAYPFNPYAINDAAPPDYAAAAVSAGFREGRKRTFVFSVR